MDRCIRHLRRWFLVLGFGIATVSIAPVQAQELCGGATYPFPFTDVASVGAAFCPGIMEAYVTGVTRGTTPTTFSPNDPVPRLQMTTFLQRSLNQALARTSRRAALNQWWTPQNTNSMQTIAVGGSPFYCAADGENIWTSVSGGNVVQVQAGTGKVLGTWTGATNNLGVIVAAGKVFVAGEVSPAGKLYVIDPTLAPGPVGVAAITLGSNPVSVTFDGTNLWTANNGGSVSIITPQSPYTVTTVSTGFNAPFGIIYDGASIWVTDYNAGKLLKLDAAGAIVQTVTVGTSPGLPVFDGANIWVPNFDTNSITVVQANSGNVMSTINTDANNKLFGPSTASFDGERVLVTNYAGTSITVFKAADLSLIANVQTGALSQPYATCSDGINFWVTLQTPGNLLRF